MPGFPGGFHPRVRLQAIVSLLDYAGIAVGSIGGALHARGHRRYEYDLVGAFGLALCSALGGGVLRDVLLGHGPPLALENPGYLYTALVAAAAALVLGAEIGERTQKVLQSVDAAAISLFAVAGTARAESFGLPWLAAVILGLLTAVGGGSLRDVLSGATPKVFERGTYYAVAALGATLVYLLLDHLDLPDGWCVGVAAVAGFLLRMGSVWFGWTTEALRGGQRGRG